MNLAHFCIPHFAEVFPDRYKQDWRSLPREIPDDFVREFGEWCGEHGVKGKYSIVPNPACVGWMDRDLPGWSKQELQASLALVREFMTPNWDIHPEMVTHTRVIDTKTGHPHPDTTTKFMEPKTRNVVIIPTMKPQSPMRFMMNAFFAAPAGSGRSNQNPMSR